MKRNILFALIALMTIISCRKDEISDGIINQPPTPSIDYEIDIIGSVVDQDGNALADVQISSGQIFVTTDENGIFKMDNLPVDGLSGAYINADAVGYFSGGDRLYTQGTIGRQVEITLVKRELSRNINSTKDETIALQSGLKLDFPANGFTLDGSDYQGLVSIYAYHLDPSEEGYLDRSPGDLSGTDESNNSYVLESFGMIAVDMETSDGKKVQLKDGFTAKITVPVDQSLLQDAPLEIPLWHFDEEIHKWMKEGNAELINGSYVGEVSHFSWWNCDDFIISANLCIQIIDTRFTGSMQDLTVELVSKSLGSAFSITDSDGTTNGLIPANEILEVIVYDLCGNVANSGFIGPFVGNGNKEVIPVVLGNLNQHIFKGTVNDCESMNLLDGTVINISIGESNYLTKTDENGNYSYTVLACNESDGFEISAYSIADGASGYVQTIGFSNTGVANVVDVNLCNEDPFIIINGELLEDSFVVAKPKPNETIIYSNANSNINNIIGFYGSTIGVFPAFISTTHTNSSNCTVTITQFDGDGGIVKGRIQGVDDLTSESFEGLFVAMIQQ